MEAHTLAVGPARGLFCLKKPRTDDDQQERSHMNKFTRRDFLKTTAVTAAAAGTVSAPFIWPKGAQAQNVVKVGILHSLTGTIAIAEKSVVDAEMLAIEEINKAGGVMGSRIEAVVEDGASDWPTFAEKARKLMERDKVAAVMGCYTSASRKAVLPVFEKLKGLLY
jgi:urea transport system substrate-binding protein